jgi:hypothetical protein
MQGPIKEQARWEANQGTNLEEALRHHWTNWKYGVNKLRFPHTKGFLQKVSTIWANALKMKISNILKMFRNQSTMIQCLYPQKATGLASKCHDALKTSCS